MAEDLSQTRVDPPRVVVEVGGIGGVPFSASEVRRGVVIGTGAEAQLRLDAKQWPRVSARHALLREREGAVFVEDLDSEAGTFVGGLRASYPGVLLKTGTRIALGSDGPTLLVTLPGSPMSTLPGFQSVPKGAAKETAEIEGLPVSTIPGVTAPPPAEELPGAALASTKPVSTIPGVVGPDAATARTLPGGQALAAIEAVDEPADEAAPTLRRAPVVGQTLLGRPPVLAIEPTGRTSTDRPPAAPDRGTPPPVAATPPAAQGPPALRPLPGMVPAPGDPEPVSRESSGLKNLPRREGSGAGPLPAREGSKPPAAREGSRPREGSKPPAAREAAVGTATDAPTMPREVKAPPGLMPVPIENVNEVARALALKVGAGARTIRLMDAVAAQVQEREKTAQKGLRKLVVALGVLVLLTGVVGGVYWWSADKREQAARARAWALSEARERERAEAKKQLADTVAAKKATEESLRSEYLRLKESSDRELVASMEATAEQKDELLRRLADEASAKARELERLAREAKAEGEGAKPEGPKDKPEGASKDKPPPRKIPPLPPVTKKPPPPPEPEKPILK